MTEEREKNYEDIINLPHPTSSKHPRMSLYDRAAQFSPFAALTGHSAAIKETERLTDRKIELDEYEKEKLNERIQVIAENHDKRTEVVITYFLPDSRKAGGVYKRVFGTVEKLDYHSRKIVLSGGREINVEDISEIDCELFREMD